MRVEQHTKFLFQILHIDKSFFACACLYGIHDNMYMLQVSSRGTVDGQEEIPPLKR